MRRRAFDPADPYFESEKEAALPAHLDELAENALEDAQNDYPEFFAQCTRLGLVVKGDAEYDSRWDETSAWITFEGYPRWNSPVGEDLKEATDALARIDREHPNLRDLVEDTAP